MTGVQTCALPISRIILVLEAEKRTTQWLRDRGDFIPLPATWLNSNIEKRDGKFIWKGKVQETTTNDERAEADRMYGRG